jgi:hypothetical protein
MHTVYAPVKMFFKDEIAIDSLLPHKLVLAPIWAEYFSRIGSELVQ